MMALDGVFCWYAGRSGVDGRKRDEPPSGSIRYPRLRAWSGVGVTRRRTEPKGEILRAPISGSAAGASPPDPGMERRGESCRTAPGRNTSGARRWPVRQKPQTSGESAVGAVIGDYCLAAKGLARIRTR
jgi:hypothetical protein